MNFLNATALVSILFLGLTIHAELIVCRTNNSQGTVILKITDPESYYNGRITLYGSTLLEYFSTEIKRMNGKCYFNGGYGVNNDACDISASVNLQTNEIFVGGRFEQGLKGFSESGGLKLLSTFNGTPNGKNWFFNNCSPR